MTVPLCRFKTLLTMFKYYCIILIFFKAHKEECGLVLLEVERHMQVKPRLAD